MRTKIICTMGPAVNTPEIIRALIASGMNVARINFSHGDLEEHKLVIEMLKEAREQLRVPLAIMLDTKGPEVRIGPLKEEPIFFRAGDRWKLVKEQIRGNQNEVSVNPPEILDQIKEGQQVLLNNGNLATKAVKRLSDGVLVEMMHDGSITSRKGINLPGIRLNLPLVTEQDKEDIKWGCLQGVDLIASSFVCSPETVLEIRKVLSEAGAEDTLIIAKIENTSGIEHFDSILQVSDGIMIARGDLGVEVPLADVPRLQKMMIRKAYLQGKTSITATQMLESMIHNRRPTRAEVSDVANAIYDSTSAVMLSGETAIGQFPVETVDVMRRVIQKSEDDFDYGSIFQQHNSLVYTDVPTSVTLAAVKTAYSANAAAILAFTNGGSTARLLSRLRPKMPIIAMTPRMKAFHQLSLVWGVIPFIGKEVAHVEEALLQMTDLVMEHHLLHYGDLVVITAGTPFGISGTTNMMVVDSIGDVLVRGHTGIGGRVHAKALCVHSPESFSPYQVRGQVLVFTHCDSSYLPLIREASGVILEHIPEDFESEHYLLDIAQALDLSVVIAVGGAIQAINNGQLLTLDPQKRIVYKGVVIED